MQTLVLYASRFGNTEAVARAIASGAAASSSVAVLDVEAVQHDALATPPDLVILGGPTHNHGPSQDLKRLVEVVARRLPGVPIACFDTRYRGPVLLMGSGATAAAKSLAKTARLVAPPESFFIVRRGSVATQRLEPGEIERAEGWGRSVAAAAVPAVQPAGR